VSRHEVSTVVLGWNDVTFDGNRAGLVPVSFTAVGVRHKTQWQKERNVTEKRREEPREVVRKPKPRKSEMHNAGN
jgi:hypothetical protein